MCWVPQPRGSIRHHALTHSSLCSLSVSSVHNVFHSSTSIDFSQRTVRVRCVFFLQQKLRRGEPVRGVVKRDVHNYLIAHHLCSIFFTTASRRIHDYLPFFPPPPKLFPANATKKPRTQSLGSAQLKWGVGPVKLQTSLKRQQLN